MLKCSKCGGDITEGSQKCPNCGVERQVHEKIPAESKYRKPVLIAIGVFAVLGIAALILASVLRNKNSDVTFVKPLPPGYDNTLLNVPQTQLPQSNVVGVEPPDLSESNILQAPEAMPIPEQNMPSQTAKPAPPQYLLDYLEFVRGVEEHRQRLLKDTQAAFLLGAINQATGGLDALLSMLDDTGAAQAKDPMQDTRNELIRQYQNWNSTLLFFGNRQPPQEAREFASYYQMVLYNETAAMYQIINTLSSATDYNRQEVTQIVSALTGMLKAGTQKSIDNAADYADRSLTNLVSNYDMQKPFSVTKEKDSGGNLLGFGF